MNLMAPMPTRNTNGARYMHQVVKRNVATGGRVTRIFPVQHFDQWTARSEADRRNEQEDREGRNVIWTIRSIDGSGATR